MSTLVSRNNETKPAATSNLLALDNTKAGMQAVDKVTVDRIINETSEGSKYYENERRKAVNRQKRIDKMVSKSAEFDRLHDKFAIERAVRDAEAEFESHRQFGRYVHLDMDMFFAAVEEKYDPSLKDVPVGVGGMAMLSTSNYKARQFGVRAAMPGYIAKKLCPELVLVKSHFDYYKKEAEVVREIAREYDANFHSGGLDELCMCLDPHFKKLEEERAAAAAENGKGVEGNVDGSKPLPTIEEVVSEIRRRIEEATQLTASAGIAPTPAISKICSNYNKPNGQYTMEATTREEVMAFMHDLPVRRVNGIGKVQEGFLNALNIHTCGEIYAQKHRLNYVMTPKGFQHLLSVGMGVMGSFGGFAVEDEAGRKSVSSETTITTISSSSQLASIVHSRMMTAHETLLDEDLACGQLVLKLKHKSYVVKQYSKSLPKVTSNPDILWRNLEALLGPHISEYADLRLVGVKLGALVDREEEENDPQPTLEQMMAKAKKRREEPMVISDGDDDVDVVCGADDAEVVGCDDDDVVMIAPKAAAVPISVSPDRDVEAAGSRPSRLCVAEVVDVSTSESQITSSANQPQSFTIIDDSQDL